MSAPLVAAAGMTFSGSLEDYPDGIIIPVDKPWRWTSADVVRKVKFAAAKHFSCRKIKVGHAGTLDPLATGVLLVCIGKATKLAEDLQKHEKEYVATVVFGATTPSYDREKEPDRFFSVDGISAASVEKALRGLTGTYEQVAPLFSAKSADGVRAYEIARKLFRAGQTQAVSTAELPGSSGLAQAAFDAGQAVADSATELLESSGLAQSAFDAGQAVADSATEPSEGSGFAQVLADTGLVSGPDLTQALDETALSLLTRNLVTVSEATLLEFGRLGREISPRSALGRNDEAFSSEAETSSLREMAPSGGKSKTASSRINVADVSGLELPAAVVRIRCSKGTYIRAFARDLGEALGSGAFLADLRRTASGTFTSPVPFPDVLAML